MKIRTSFLLLSLVIVALLNGCTVNFSSADLIHPPKTTGNQAEIEQLIGENAGGEYMLKYPQSGDYRSAIVMEDLNNDKIDEAIACYRTQDDDPVTHLLIMYDTGKKWKISCDYKTQYSDIDCFQFADYDYDGNKELFTGFLTYTTGVNELAVFDFDEKNKTAHHTGLTKFYTSFTTGDYDRDGTCEALLLTLNTTDTQAKATLIDYNNNELSALVDCSLDPAVTKFENVTSGMIDDKNMGVVVDGLLTDSYNSQVIFYDCDNELLINSLFESDLSTEKTHLIKSQDVDSDGFIEIPQLSSCHLPKNARSSTPAPLITWNNFDTSDYHLEYDISCLTNFDFKYSFLLPDNFVNTTTALVSKDNRTMSIYSLQGNKKEKLILSFKVFDNSTTARETEGFTSLENYSKYIYTYKIADGALPIYIDDKTVENNFKLNDISTQNIQ